MVDGGSSGGCRRLAGVAAEKIGLPKGLAELVGVDERRGFGLGLSCGS